MTLACEVRKEPYRITRRPADADCLAVAVLGLPVGPVRMERKGDRFECAFYVAPGEYTYRICEAYPEGKAALKGVSESPEDARDYFGRFLTEPFAAFETRKTRTFEGPNERITATLEAFNEAASAVTLELYPEQDWIKLWFDKYRLPPRGSAEVQLEVEAARLGEGVNRGLIRAGTAYFSLPPVEVVAEVIPLGRVLAATQSHVDLGTLYAGSTVTFDVPAKNVGAEPVTACVEGDLPGYEEPRVYELPPHDDEAATEGPLLEVKVPEELGAGPRHYSLRIRAEEPYLEVVDVTVSFMADEVRLIPPAIDFGRVPYPGRVEQTVALETASGSPPEDAVLLPDEDSGPYLEIEAGPENNFIVNLDSSALARGGAVAFAARLHIGGRDVGLALPISAEVLLPRPRVSAKSLYYFPVGYNASLTLPVVNDGDAGITFTEITSEGPLSLLTPVPPFTLGPGETTAVTFVVSPRELAGYFFPNGIVKKIRRLRKLRAPFVTRVRFTTVPPITPALAAEVRLYPSKRKGLFLNCVWPELTVITVIFGCISVVTLCLLGLVISIMAGWA